MKSIRWQVLLGIALVVLSAFVYFIHYLIFHDVHHIFIYFVGDVAFVFIEVLLVTLIIHRLLGEREKRSMLEKMNMVIGTFFSEVGIALLRTFSRVDLQCSELRSRLVGTKNFTDREFTQMSEVLKGYSCSVKPTKDDLAELRLFLVGKRAFLLRLLANPNLLEHDTFTHLLWAVFHLTDELAHRKDLGAIPESDHKHLTGDVERAYLLLISEWVDYMKHLKVSYPYLFSLAMRTNPFDPEAKPEVA